MNKAMFLITILLLTTLPMNCINHMDLIQTMAGEFAGCEFGSSMASLDFNGDGYMDLVVNSQAWNPYSTYAESARYGKLYFYWGGPNFDNIPDFTITGNYPYDLGSTYGGIAIYNAGDVNGDGIEDFVRTGSTADHKPSVSIYYGRAVPQATPDLVFSYPTENLFGLYPYPLGDINGDNKDDLSIILKYETPYRNKTMILTDVNAVPWFFDSTDIDREMFMQGIGDINNDGYDDCYKVKSNEPGYQHYNLIVYYGSPQFPVTDSLVICESTDVIPSRWGNPVGDVNNDGFADFVAFDGPGVNQPLWFGGTQVTPNWDILLTHSNYGYTDVASGFPYLHGDFNNDGFDDVLGANFGYGGWSGIGFIWMGRTQMNGTIDLLLWPPPNYEYRSFGWAKATGDFNADGFCDVAASSPWWGDGGNHNETGKVFIYAGNAELADTTVGVEDDTIPVPDVSKWDISISPNPVTNKLSQINIQFTGSGYKNAANLKVSIFDIKGRKVLSQAIPDNKLREGNWSFALKGIKPGVYILNISDNNIKLITRKFAIK